MYYLVILKVTTLVPSNLSVTQTLDLLHDSELRFEDSALLPPVSVVGILS